MPESLYDSALKVISEDMDYLEDLDLKNRDTLQSTISKLNVEYNNTVTRESVFRLCEDAIKYSRHAFKMIYHRDISTSIRRIFTDAIIISVCLQCLGNLSEKSKIFWEHMIAILDETIIVAGAPGLGRLDIVHALVRKIQKDHLLLDSQLSVPRYFSSSQISNIELPVASQMIPVFNEQISLSKFFGVSHSPFIIKSYGSDWPAMEKWISPEYLLRAGGPGRIVPVEIGDDYTSKDWTQKLIKWEDFLSELSCSDRSPNEQRPLYLAQHSLLKQMPELRDDIYLPDYVYSSPPPPGHFPEYRPPSNEEQLVINAWIGPRHTVSPAHTDPYYNCYVQVFGRKTIWLASPHLSSFLSKRSEGDSDLLSNTARIDVFQPCEISSQLAQESMTAVLEPGDMLHIPPLWWHAMRSEDISASVSMWF